MLSTISPSFAHIRQRNVAEQGLTFYAQHVRSMKRWQRKVLKMALCQSQEASGRTVVISWKGSLTIWPLNRTWQLQARRRWTKPGKSAQRRIHGYAHSLLTIRLRMGVDVYNDCLIETVSARSWPMRSLACLASDHLLATMRQYGADVEFVPFTPASSDLHYRDPNYYKQMLDVIYELEKVRLSQMFNRCTCADWWQLWQANVGPQVCKRTDG